MFLATPTEALATAGKLVQDDLILMVENDGEFCSTQIARMPLSRPE